MSGVKTFVHQSRSAVEAGTLTESNFIIVNDVKISGFAVENNDASGSLVSAINAVSDETGVLIVSKSNYLTSGCIHFSSSQSTATNAQWLKVASNAAFLYFDKNSLLSFIYV